MRKRNGKRMNKFSCSYFLLILLFLSGCSGNVKNLPTDVSPTESVIVGRIETVPVLWEFSLYEEHSKTEDLIDIAGKGFGLTQARKLQNQGYLFKIARPGIYILRLKKRIEGRYDHDEILRFEVPAGKLVYFGTVKIVIDDVSIPSFQGYRIPNKPPMKFKYHYERIDENTTLKRFEELYPQVYSTCKDKIIRIPPPSPSRPTYLTLLPTDHSLQNSLTINVIDLSPFDPPL